MGKSLLMMGLHFRSLNSNYNKNLKNIYSFGYNYYFPMEEVMKMDVMKLKGLGNIRLLNSENPFYGIKTIRDFINRFDNSEKIVKLIENVDKKVKRLVKGDIFKDYEWHGEYDTDSIFDRKKRQEIEHYQKMDKLFIKFTWNMQKEQIILIHQIISIQKTKSFFKNENLHCIPFQVTPCILLFMISMFRFFVQETKEDMIAIKIFEYWSKGCEHEYKTKWCSMHKSKDQEIKMWILHQITNDKMTMKYNQKRKKCIFCGHPFIDSFWLK